MTGLLVAVGLLGHPQLAADIGIVQGAALALFFAFSANARNLIIKTAEESPVRTILLARALLILPLSAGAYYFGSLLGGVTLEIAVILILRKAIEWLTEIHLAEAEREADAAFALRHLLLQSLLLATAVIWVATDSQGLLIVLSLWAVSPILLSLQHFQRVLKGSAVKVPIRALLPHLGSSAVTGIGVYAFRLSILLLAGKVMAGDLYTAFAIGGILGSIFAQGVGPSLVLNEKNTGNRNFPPLLRWTLALTTLTGLGLITASRFVPTLAGVAAKSPSLWLAAGISLIGGVVMVFAQRQRLRDLQRGTQEDVFAQDVLVNMLVVFLVPGIYFFFGPTGFSWLYLCSATLALVFYWMADPDRATLVIKPRYEKLLRVGIVVLLVAPVFFTLETGLFRSDEHIYDSMGALNKLPLPISIFVCYAGILLLGNFRRANLALAVIFGFYMLMMISTVVTTAGDSSQEKAKLLLLVQFILPTFGLVLGMMYEDQERLVEKSMLVVLLCLLPAQLLSTLLQGSPVLVPTLHLFSVYQHLQYVPVVVSSIFIICMFSLWDERKWRFLIIALAPIFGMYIAASESMAATGLAFAGCIAFALLQKQAGTLREDAPRRWAVLGLVAGCGVFWSTWVSYSASSLPFGINSLRLSGSRVASVHDRLEIWMFYLNGITSDLYTSLVGHAAPPGRYSWPSAHNYYLDVTYNFGALAAAVPLSFALFTVVKLYLSRKSILVTPAMIGLAGVVLFLVFPDSLIKVGLRQPYPGIFAFFLWGMLLARINLASNKNGDAQHQ